MFFDRLKELCETKGIRMSNLLKELNMSPGNITRWKNGTVPDGNTLVSLAKYFTVSTDYLLGLNDEREQFISMPDTLTQKLIAYFQKIDEDGKLRIIQTAMNEYDRSESERKKAQAGNAI